MMTSQKRKGKRKKMFKEWQQNPMDRNWKFFHNYHLIMVNEGRQKNGSDKNVPSEKVSHQEWMGGVIHVV